MASLKFRIAAATVWLAFAGPVWAATLHGEVTDDSGGAVPSAKITLVSESGSSRTAMSDPNGTYVFSNIVPGSYTVQASAPQLILLPSIKIDLAEGTRILDITLSVAPMEQQVEVNTDAPTAVSTAPDNNATALVVRGSDLDALSDNPEDLVADLQALAGPSAGPSGGSIYVDGFSNGELPSKESIREVRINQNPFSPEYDKLGFGRIEVITKPGSAKFHGNLNYNIGSDVWNARNPYSAVKAPLLLEEWENTVSGPISKRASFILDANQNNVDNGSIVNAVTLDPRSLTPSPFFDTFRTIQRRTRLYPRLDYQLNDTNTLTFRYSFTRGDIQGAGIGGFDLISRGYHTRYTTNTLQFIETALLGANTVNETRFQYYRNASQNIPNSTAAEIQVLGSFNGGGTQIGMAADTQNSFELQNNTTTQRGKQAWDFGIRARLQQDDNVSPLDFNGIFTFGGGLAPVLDANNQPELDSSGQPMLEQINSIESYRRTLLFENLGMSASQIRTLGGEPSQFSINTGAPERSVSLFDVGVFAGDDWKVRPNVTLSLGLRYETQTNIGDWHDFAPRVGVAWAPRSNAHSAPPKLVLRGGFGIFYDRFALSNTLAVRRYNGIVQQEYVITDPSFFPALPPIVSLGPTQITQEVSSNLHAPGLLQSAVTVERQLARQTTFAVTFTNSYGIHMLRSEDVNAPIQGTYIPGVTNSGVYPLGHPGAVFQMQSAGRYNQNQLIVNVNSRVNSGVSLSGSYVLNRAMSDTDGVTTFPASPYTLAGEYGPAGTDARHRLTLTGAINTKWNIRFSPLVTLQSGLPFDITTGSDLYGTTLLNGRPGIPTDLTKPGLIQTKYGLLDPNPTPDETILSRNYGRGPGQIMLNLRIGKAFGLGPQRSSDAAKSRPLGALAGIFSPAPDNHRFTLLFSASMRNILNHTNPGPIIGNITSPLFGRANQMFGTVNGEGFSENANNRRLELQTRLTF